MTFVETPTFQRHLLALYSDRLLDAEGYRALQNALLTRTTRIDMMPGTGGIEKARWKTKSGGKRGGLRVIFYHHEPTAQILLLAIYKKGRKDDLTAEEKAVLKAIVERNFK